MLAADDEAVAPGAWIASISRSKVMVAFHFVDRVQPHLDKCDYDVVRDDDDYRAFHNELFRFVVFLTENSLSRSAWSVLCNFLWASPINEPRRTGGGSWIQ